MDGASSMDQQPAGQQQQMPGGVAPVEQQPVPDGQVAAGQQQQAFIRSPLHPPPELQRLLEQQRGYVDEMFRQQHEVVRLQLARIQQQQLEFMQRQGHILRNIVAAVNEQGGNSSPIGGIFKAVMKVDSDCLSSFVDRKLAADVVLGFRSAERRTTAKYRPLEDVLDQLKQDLFFSPVAIPERFLVVREEGERLQGKYTCRRQYKHQQPGTTAVLEASQQLTEPKLAGPNCEESGRSGRGDWNVSCARALAVSTTSYQHHDHPSSPCRQGTDLRHRYRCHAVLQG
ncbi:hypothetical protein quinque_008690 [Culex quinquefasciatus]